LVISGSVPRPVVATLVERYFGDWRRGSGELPPPPPVDWKPTPGIYFLSYPFAQSTIFIGHLGPRRLTPDYPAIDGFNELFGSSGFSARLTKRVRTELGLAYGIFGAVVPAVVKGRNLVQLQTKSESTGLGVVESIDVLQNMQKELVSADELNEARRSITNSFVFKFDSTDELVQRAALLRLLDYPLDYDATYVDKIESLTPEDIRTAAKAHWDPSQFVLVVVGNETAYTSLEKAAKEHPALLGQFPIRRMRFDQKLVF
jgi:zinc protease